MVSTSRCGRDNPGSNPGYSSFFFLSSEKNWCIVKNAALGLFADNHFQTPNIFSRIPQKSKSFPQNSSVENLDKGAQIFVKKGAERSLNQLKDRFLFFDFCIFTWQQVPLQREIRSMSHTLRKRIYRKIDRTSAVFKSKRPTK